MSVDWMAGQLALLRRVENAGTVKRFNPNPPNQMKENSITHNVYLLFNEHPNRFFAKHQVVECVTHSRTDIKNIYKAVDWALIFLRSQGIVEAVIDSRRNTKYNRYRLNPNFVAKK